MNNKPNLVAILTRQTQQSLSSIWYLPGCNAPVDLSALGSLDDWHCTGLRCDKLDATWRTENQDSASG